MEDFSEHKNEISGSMIVGNSPVAERPAASHEVSYIGQMRSSDNTIKFYLNFT
jgi:hypothetical protein